MDSVLVLIAAPGSGAIGARAVDALRDFGAAPPQWLARGEALEVPVFPRLAEFLAETNDLPLDANVIPVSGRRKRLLVADMDSTMIRQECIDELGAAAGIGDRIAAITARAMRGELDFEAALRERVALLKGLDAALIGWIIRERISLMPGARTLVATMRLAGAHTALVSGGFRQFTSAVANLIGFDEDQANELVIEGGRLAGTVREPILGERAKTDALRRLCAARGISPASAIAVGDGANDIAMLNAAGLGVALHAKPHVQKSARIRINHGDLTALLYLQGYRKEEFVTG